MTKTRFCPSPTGYIHLGNARTALFNVLLAKHESGAFLFRIEDTDQARFEQDYVDCLLEDLQWLGLQWDEGPGCDVVEHAPYFQSKRQAIYDKYYEVLIEKGQAYPCFCSEQQLDFARKAQQRAGQPPRYSGTCASLSVAEVAKKLADGLKPTLRFRVPRAKQIIFEDLVKGRQAFNSDDMGDFIIRRANGTASFMYCNALDDALMGVTHALRGEDHLTNTPRQLMILEVLGLPCPQYGHLSLILGATSGRLSKREGSGSVRELRQEGYFPLAVLNYLARLGHYYESTAFMTLPELAKEFKVQSLIKAPARFDESQLLYWQKEAVIRADVATFMHWIGDAAQLVPAHLQADFIAAIKPNTVLPQDVALWANALFAQQLTYDEIARDVITQTPAEFWTTAIDAIKQHHTDFKAISAAIKNTLGVKGKQLFLPLRIAFSGQQHGPEMQLLVDLLGEQQLIRRLMQVSQSVT